MAAKIRHELEHVRQWVVSGRARRMFELYDVVMYALEEFVGTDRRGSGVLYNVVRFEADANTAACEFAEQWLQPHVVARLATSEHGVLFRRGPWTPEPETVALRSVCLAALAPDRAEAYLPEDGQALALFGGLTGDHQLWPRLRARSDIAALADEARSAVPSSEALSAAAPDFTAPWQELRATLHRGIRLAGTEPGA